MSSRTSGHCFAEAREQGREQVDEQRVVGGHAQLAGRRELPSRDLAGEGGDVVVHPLRQGDHLLAGRGERVAAAVALEELGPERLLDLAEAAEHGRVVDAEPRRGGRQAARVGDGLDQAEVVPGQVLERFDHDEPPSVKSVGAAGAEMPRPPS